PAAGGARVHAIAIVRLRTSRHDPLAKRRRFIWLVLARGLHEQGDLDAVVDVELVEEAGDVGLDRGDGEVQRRGNLGVGLAPADGEGDIPLAWAERRQPVAGLLGAGAGVGVAGHHGDEPACDRGREHAVAGVDELEADHRGRLPRRTNAPSGSTPCSSVPPASETRSASPIRPVPAPGSGAAAATATGARLRTSTSRSPSGARTVSVTAAPGACLRAFVRPSCAIRYAVRPTAAGGAASPSSIRAVIRMPAARDSSTRSARSASVGWGGCVRLSPPSSRRTPITPRSSSSAARALSRITPAASATSSAGAS